MKSITTIAMKRFLLLSILFAAVFCTCCTEDAAPIFGDVYGTITDSKTGEPVRNAEVILSPTNATTISGSDGHFEFRSLEAGQYKISVSSDGYEVNSRQVTVVPGKSTACDMHLTPKAVVEIFNVDPLTLDFGATQTQMAVTVTNSSTRDTQWALDLGLNTWLKASPIAGQIGAGKSQTIVFSVNRVSLADRTSGIVTFSALGGSSSLTVNCSPSQQTSTTMEVTPLNIDFDDLSTEQIFRIKNNSEDQLNWTLSGLNEDAITVSDTSGTIQSGNSKVVAIKLDRSKLSGNHLTTSFMISDGENDQQVNVNVGSHESNVSDNPDEPVVGAVGLLALSTNVLDFGISLGLLPLTITNTGDASLDWSILDVQDDIFTFSSDSGALEAGDSAEITVYVDRDKLTSGFVESVFAISDGVNIYVVTVKFEVPVYTDGKIKVSPTTLDFGTSETQLNLAVENVGTTHLMWTVTDVPYYMTFNDGYLTHKQSPNSKITNRITLDRDMMPKEVDTYITITNDFNPSDTQRVHITASNTEIVGSRIAYTSSDGNVVTPCNASAFGANIVSNVYENGKGVITFDGEVTSIGLWAFYGCSKLTSIIIPEGVTTIDSNAFSSCNSLTSVTIPDGVTSIGLGAFSDCNSLTSVAIPDGVTSIGSIAFYGCSSLTSITIPNGVTKIENSTFADCRSLISITIPDSVTSIGENAFGSCMAVTSITIPNGVTKIENSTFANCTRLISITIPDSVTSIGENAFQGCIAVPSITIPDGVTSIGDWAFNDCRALTSINIPDGVTTIGPHTFGGCGFTSIVIPDGVTSIGDGAFAWCGFTSITIPDSVTSFGDRVFDNCHNLSKVRCMSVVPPTVDGSAIFESSLAKNYTIYVPTSSVEAYKTADVWSKYADKIVGCDF